MSSNVNMPTRREFARLSALTLAGAGSSLIVAGCGSTASSSSDDSGSTGGSSDSGSSRTLRIGMEAAYAPYNWQTDTESEYTIPIEGLDGAYADGYDVQIAKSVAKTLGREPVAVKLAWDGLIDAVKNGTIDLIIAGMTATPEREESIDFTDAYFVETYGLLVRKDSSYADATSLSDFSGAAVIGQKDTIYDEIIDDIPDVNHLTPAASVPAVISAVDNGTADAGTYSQQTTDAVLRSNTDLTNVNFADGEGFTEESECNIGLAKGQDDLLSQLNDALSQISDDERDEMWQGACDRQPA
jgi:putative lysine transport system substrate-binding protein